MGWLSALGKIAGAVTGLGSVMGAQQGGAASGREKQAAANLAFDRNALDRYQTEQGAQFNAGNLDLQRKDYESGNRATTAKQSLIASLLGGAGGGMDPTSIQDGKASGGLLAALKSNPDAMAAMRNLHGQADQAQMAPSNFQGGNLLTAPKLTPVPQIDKGGFMSTLASILQGAGAVGSGLSGLSSGGSSSPSVPNMPTLQGLGGLPGQALPPLVPPKKHIVDDLDGDGSNRG